MLEHAWLTFFACLLVAVGSGALYFNLDNELLPTEDRGKIRIFARGPDGVGLNFMDRQAVQMEDILLPYVESGEIESIYTVVGQWDPNIGDLLSARLSRSQFILSGISWLDRDDSRRRAQPGCAIGAWHVWL